jgi:hypothetical protein
MVFNPAKVVGYKLSPGRAVLNSDSIKFTRDRTVHRDRQHVRSLRSAQCSESSVVGLNLQELSYRELTESDYNVC